MCVCVSLPPPPSLSLCVCVCLSLSLARARALSLSLVGFVYDLVPPFWEHLRILVQHSCCSYVARGCLFGLYWVLFSFFDHYIQRSYDASQFISEDLLHEGVRGR